MARFRSVSPTRNCPLGARKQPSCSYKGCKMQTRCTLTYELWKQLHLSGPRICHDIHEHHVPVAVGDLNHIGHSRIPNSRSKKKRHRALPLTMRPVHQRIRESNMNILSKPISCNAYFQLGERPPLATKARAPVAKNCRLVAAGLFVAPACCRPCHQCRPGLACSLQELQVASVSPQAGELTNGCTSVRFACPN